jgi:hypothetical protein
MTDDLRERLAQVLRKADDDAWLYPLCEKEYYEGLADIVLTQFRPGDVLPNGWVAPDEATDAMANAWCSLALDRLKRRLKDDKDCKGSFEGAKESFAAMRAAAMRESTSDTKSKR